MQSNAAELRNYPKFTVKRADNGDILTRTRFPYGYAGMSRVAPSREGDPLAGATRALEQRKSPQTEVETTTAAVSMLIGAHGMAFVNRRNEVLLMTRATPRCRVFWKGADGDDAAAPVEARVTKQTEFVDERGDEVRLELSVEDTRTARNYVKLTYEPDGLVHVIADHDFVDFYTEAPTHRRRLSQLTEGGVGTANAIQWPGAMQPPPPIATSGHDDDSRRHRACGQATK